MGRFYFHLRAGDELISDDVGIDLPDLSAAKREAVLSARELLAEAIKTGKQTVPDAFVIADDKGRPLDMVSLVMSLEDRLGVQIPDDELSGIERLEQALELLQNKVGTPA